MRMIMVIQKDIHVTTPYCKSPDGKISVESDNQQTAVSWVQISEKNTYFIDRYRAFQIIFLFFKMTIDVEISVIPMQCQLNQSIVL